MVLTWVVARFFHFVALGFESILGLEGPFDISFRVARVGVDLKEWSGAFMLRVEISAPLMGPGL